MELKDFKPGDIVTVTVTEQHTAPVDGTPYDFSAWSRTRMEVVSTEGPFVELLALDNRPDRDWLMRNWPGSSVWGEDPNEVTMFWRPEDLKKIS